MAKFNRCGLYWFPKAPHLDCAVLLSAFFFPAFTPNGVETRFPGSLLPLNNTS